MKINSSTVKFLIKGVGVYSASVAVGAGCAASHGSISINPSGPPSALMCSNIHGRSSAGFQGTVRITSSSNFWCAVSSDSTVSCEGDNTFGQLGLGDTRYRASPATIAGLRGVEQLEFTGNGAACARTASGEVWCWGANLAGEVGVGCSGQMSPFHGAGAERQRCLSPVRVEGIPPVARLVTGGRSVCAVAVDREVWCWGTVVESARRRVYEHPTRIGALDGGMQFGLFRDSALWIQSDGSVATTDGTAPVRVPSGSKLRSNFFGTLCVVTADQRVQCMGGNVGGVVGIGDAATSSIAVLRDLGLRCVVDVVVGLYHACALHSGGEVSCWGDNSAGQTGERSTSTACGRDPCTPVPVRVLGVDDAVSISLGGFTTCVTRSDLSTWCWGAGPGGWSSVPQQIHW